MIVSPSHSFLLAVVLCLIPHSFAQIANNLQDCITADEFDPNVNYFPQKYTPQDAVYKGPPEDFFAANTYVPHNSTDLLTIDYYKYYKIVTNKYHNKSYLLYQCGTTPPPEQLDGRHDLVLSVPHTGGIAVTETPQIPPLELLGLRRDILAYFGNGDFVSSPCLRHLMDDSDEQTVQVYFDPNDPYNSTTTAASKREFLQEHPDALILEGPWGNVDAPRTIGMAASQERTNVATFDWIGLIAALYNLEGLATEIAQETLQRYECSSANAVQVFASADQAQPVVLWATFFASYGWSVAECPTWNAAYYCEYAKHCGATILERGPYGSSDNGLYFYLNDTELLELGKDADYWIFPSPGWEELYESKKEYFDQFKAVQNQQVYDTQGLGRYAWFEQRLAEYEVVALDFCDIVGTANPTEPLHARRWLRNVYKDEIKSLEQCQVPEEIDEPYVPKSAECTRLVVKDDDGEPMEDGSTKQESSGLRLMALCMMSLLVGISTFFAISLPC